MLQQDKPDDYLLATNETHTVREFAEKTAKCLGIDLIWKGKSINEKGLDKKTGKTIIEIDSKIFPPGRSGYSAGRLLQSQKTTGLGAESEICRISENNGQSGL